MNAPAESNFTRILTAFNTRSVDYVLIGGGAAWIHGSTRATEDLDFLVRNHLENRERVALALHELGARTPRGMALDHEDLKNANTLWTTDHGRVDILVAATGPGDSKLTYDDIRPHAVAISGLIPGQLVFIASLEDLIVMKTAAGRPKDLAALPELRRLARPPALSLRPTDPLDRHEPPQR